MVKGAEMLKTGSFGNEDDILDNLRKTGALEDMAKAVSKRQNGIGG